MVTKQDSGLTGLIVKLVLGFVVLLVGIIVVVNSVTTVGADEIVVKQSLFTGKLDVWTDPGVHGQWFGHVTRYKKSSQYWFSAREDEGKPTDDSIKVRFNDGGHGNVSGSLRYNLPLDAKNMVLLHSTYGSMEAINHELIQQVVNKSVFMTGPLMSSRESYAEKRSDLIADITDQITNGVYRTERKSTETTDPLTNLTKTVDFVVPKTNPTAPNGIEREETSPIAKFGMSASNITINAIDYDPVVEQQIKQQQEAIMAVQQSIVNARKAEQDTITVEQQGKAEAAKAKWTQEVSKATAVTAAEQEKEVAVTQAQKDKDVAELALQTAKLAAQHTVTDAKADADAKRLAVTANNNLELRINAWVQVQTAWANAYGNQRQTPDTVVGSGSGGGNGLNQGVVDMLMVKTARDLQLNPKP